MSAPSLLPAKTEARMRTRSWSVFVRWEKSGWIPPTQPVSTHLLQLQHQDQFQPWQLTSRKRLTNYYFLGLWLVSCYQSNARIGCNLVNSESRPWPVECRRQPQPFSSSSFQLLWVSSPCWGRVGFRLKFNHLQLRCFVSMKNWNDVMKTVKGIMIVITHRR